MFWTPWDGWPTVTNLAQDESLGFQTLQAFMNPAPGREPAELGVRAFAHRFSV